MKKGRIGRVTMWSGELIKNTLVVIFWFRRTSAMMVHGIGRTITTDLEDYHKVTNILKERANTINMK